MTEERQIDFGSIQIHKKVLADIVLSVIDGMENVSLIESDLLSRLTKLCGRSVYPGISVIIDKDNEVTIEVRITVRYGMHISDIARQVQDKIRTDVEKIADVNLKDINVNIQGIERGNL